MIRFTLNGRELTSDRLLLGVAGDRDAEELSFTLPAQYDGVDVGTYSVALWVENRDGESDVAALSLQPSGGEGYVASIPAQAAWLRCPGRVRMMLSLSRGEEVVMQSLPIELQVASAVVQGEGMPIPEPTFLTQAQTYMEQAREAASQAAEDAALCEEVRDTLQARYRVLGSYDSLEELNQAHPENELGDAYLVVGVIYIWDGEKFVSVMDGLDESLEALQAKTQSLEGRMATAENAVAQVQGAQEGISASLEGLSAEMAGKEPKIEVQGLLKKGADGIVTAAQEGVDFASAGHVSDAAAHFGAMAPRVENEDVLTYPFLSGKTYAVKNMSNAVDAGAYYLTRIVYEAGDQGNEDLYLSACGEEKNEVYFLRRRRAGAWGEWERLVTGQTEVVTVPLTFTGAEASVRLFKQGKVVVMPSVEVGPTSFPAGGRPQTVGTLPYSFAGAVGQLFSATGHTEGGALIRMVVDTTSIDIYALEDSPPSDNRYFYTPTMTWYVTY